MCVVLVGRYVQHGKLSFIYFCVTSTASCPGNSLSLWHKNKRQSKQHSSPMWWFFWRGLLGPLTQQSIAIVDGVREYSPRSEVMQSHLPQWNRNTRKVSSSSRSARTGKFRRARPTRIFTTPCQIKQAVLHKEERWLLCLYLRPRSVGDPGKKVAPDIELFS